MLSDSQPWHTCVRVSDLLFLNCHSFSQDMTRFSYIIMSRHILCMLLSKSNSLRCSSSRVFSEKFHSWRRRWILIYCCSFLMHVVQIANHQYHLLLLQLPLYANQTIRAFEILSFFFYCIFPAFSRVNAGSALHEVSIPLWRAFRQVQSSYSSFLPCLRRCSIIKLPTGELDV